MNRLRSDGLLKEANNGSVPQGNKELRDAGVVGVERNAVRRASDPAKIVEIGVGDVQAVVVEVERALLDPVRPGGVELPGGAQSHGDVVELRQLAVPRHEILRIL